MKVWLIQRAESTPHDDNGARRLMRMGVLANMLESLGHTVVWWTSAFDHVTHTRRFDKSIRVKVTEKYSIHYLKCFGYTNNKSLSRVIDNAYVARQFLKEANKDDSPPDVILAAIPSIELAKKAVVFANNKNIPIFIDVRDLWPDVFFDIFPKGLHWLIKLATFTMRKNLKLTCKNATGITGITDEFVKWGVKHSGRSLGASDTTFPMAYVKLNNSVTSVEDAYSFWESKGVTHNKNTIYVLFLGTFTKSFDFGTLFIAAKKLEKNSVPVKFIFCGVGANEKTVKSECMQNENCIFAGWVNSAQIYAALKLSSIGIAPYIESPNFINNIPNKPAEYMSEGLAVANSMSRGALYDLLDQKECGFSYNGNADMLVEYLTDLSINKNKLNQMRLFSKDVFEKFFDGRTIYSSMINYLENAAKT